MGSTEITTEPGMPTIDVAREFNAPRDLVFRAYSEPDLMVQWLGPRAYTMVVDEYDLRHGGSWRYVHRAEDGSEFAFHGVFHGPQSVEGMTQTFEFEGWPGHVALERVTFEDVDGRTLVRTHSVYQSVEDRDAMVESGMESGMNEGFERLDELLARLVPVS